jgi:signal peptidase II
MHPPAPLSLNAFAAFIAALALDRATKVWALSNLDAALSGKESSFFALSLHFNAGLTFSLLKEFPAAAWWLALAGAGFLGIVCLKNRMVRSAPGIPLLWAGATGNLMDRVMYGHVVDWIYVDAGYFNPEYFNPGYFRPGYFNLADIWLCVGFCLFFVQCARSFRSCKTEAES